MRSGILRKRERLPMKILFTGASSFTGYWFARDLVKRGHEVWATFTRPSAEAYGLDVRAHRVARVVSECRPVYSCRFGDDTFLSLLKCEKFQLLCHHGAVVTNYKSRDFDVNAAVATNSYRAPDVLQILFASGGKLILTGSVFEPGEGAGSEGLPAFSPYGLSKKLTFDTIARECDKFEGALGKFVIPNPFGPWEDARFTSYLARTWSKGDIAKVRTPAYVRDNIHVSLLSAAYVAFAEEIDTGGTHKKYNPSGYIETQGAFAGRVASELRQRTGWECRLEIAEQSEFEEPRERFNTEPVNGAKFEWSESTAWDEFAEYYRHTLDVN